MKSLGRPRRKRKENIKIDLKETVCEDLHWIRLAEGKVLWRDSVNAVMNFLVAWRAENLMTSWTTTSCSIHGIHLFFFFVGVNCRDI